MRLLLAGRAWIIWIHEVDHEVDKHDDVSVAINRICAILCACLPYLTYYCTYPIGTIPVAVLRYVNSYSRGSLHGYAHNIILVPADP